MVFAPPKFVISLRSLAVLVLEILVMIYFLPLAIAGNSPHFTLLHVLHVTNNICDRLWENRAQRGMRRRRKKIDLVLKIVLNKPNEGNG